MGIGISVGMGDHHALRRACCARGIHDGLEIMVRGKTFARRIRGIEQNREIKPLHMRQGRGQGRTIAALIENNQAPEVFQFARDISQPLQPIRPRPRNKPTLGSKRPINAAARKPITMPAPRIANSIPIRESG